MPHGSCGDSRPSVSSRSLAALGIGANGAIFGVIHGILLRPLAYPNAGRLVTILERKPGLGRPVRRGVESHRLPARRFPSHTISLARVGSYAAATLVLTGPQESTRVEAVRLSADVFPILGVTPLLGRAFNAGDEAAGAEEVAVLSHATWQRDFGGAANVLARTLTLDGRAVVIGVMPPGFQFPEAQTQIFLPYDCH